MSKKTAAESNQRLFPLQYEINILKDGSLQKSTPIICEEYPTYQNLFGFIVSPTIGGRTFQPSHLDVKGGNFLQASGGFLLLDAEDLLKEKQAWKYLKRTLKTGFLAILPEAVQPKEGRGNVIPKNIAVDVKVILIGSEDLYENLFSRDPEFSRLFKVSADFDTVMPRTAETMGGYLNFIEVQSCENGIRPMDMGGKAEVIRYGTKLAEDRSKLTTRFEEILDLIVEAEYWAKKKDSPIITGKIIRETLEKRHYRSNMAEEKINELIADGDIYIPLREPRVGQINALAIHERGFLAFGTPCLISREDFPGGRGNHQH